MEYMGKRVMQSGVYDGVDWKITDDNTLIIGEQGVDEVLDARDRNEYDWPWYDMSDDLEHIEIHGNVEANGSLNGMFYACENVRDIDLTGLNTENATSMKNMFEACFEVEKLDVSKFDTSSVKSMSAMFAGCRSLKELDVSNFNTRRSIFMDGMFTGCENLEKLDLSNFSTENVMSMKAMFRYCDNLKDLDISSFRTGKVVNMTDMFAFCQSLEKLDLSKFDTSQVENMAFMFEGCNSLKHLDISNFDIKNIPREDMFRSCDNLEDLKCPFLVTTIMSDWSKEKCRKFNMDEFTNAEDKAFLNKYRQKLNSMQQAVEYQGLSHDGIDSELEK